MNWWWKKKPSLLFIRDELLKLQLENLREDVKYYRDRSLAFQLEVKQLREGNDSIQTGS